MKEGLRALRRLDGVYVIEGAHELSAPIELLSHRGKGGVSSIQRGVPEAVPGLDEARSRAPHAASPEDATVHKPQRARAMGSVRSPP